MFKMVSEQLRDLHCGAAHIMKWVSGLTIEVIILCVKMLTTNYMTKDTIFFFGIIIISNIIRRYWYFPLTSPQVESLPRFWMAVVQRRETKRFERVGNNSMEACPALPHKKENEGASSLLSRSRGKTLRTTFPFGETSTERSETQGRRRDFYWFEQTNRTLLIHEFIHRTFRFPPDRPPIPWTVGANIEM